jgi:hypothetical protein
MTDVVRPETDNKEVRTESTSNWVDTVLKHAPQLTISWGPYLAFVAIITIIAVIGLIIAKSETAVWVVTVVLAALWSPLLAAYLGLIGSLNRDKSA